MIAKSKQPEPAVLYVRKSRVRKDADLPGLERQEQDCAEYCATHNLEAVATFSDKQSAWTGSRPRPGLRAAFEALAGGKAKHFIVWRLDRATRGGVLGFAELMAGLDRAAFHSVLEGLDCSTPMGRGVAGILAAVAEQESENTSTRVKRSIAQQIEEGKKHGGTSYGYRGEEIHEEEATIINEIGTRVLAKESLRSICRDLNERRIPTAKNAAGGWTPSTLSGLLRSPYLRGIRKTGEQEVPGRWEAIWTPEYQASVIASIQTKEKRVRKPNLLGGLGILFCGACGAPMRSAPDKRRGERYVCEKKPVGCGRISVSQSIADEKVKEEFIGQLDLLKVRPDAPPVDQLAILLEEDEKALAELTADRYIHRKITDAVFTPAHDTLSARIRETKASIDARQVARVDPSILPPVGGAAEWWERVSLEERRTALQAVFTVEVLPVGRTGCVPNKGRVAVTLSLAWARSNLENFSE